MVGELLNALRAGRPQLVAIGASAGAVDALGALLPSLSKAFPLPVLVVVHVPAERPNALPALFAGMTGLAVLEVEDKMALEAGTLYVAAPDYHLLVERSLVAALSSDEPVHNSRPSIDVLFESVADACGPRAVGVLLSGANADGARGLARMYTRGAITRVQHPDTATMRTMPDAALALVPHQTCDPATIGRALAEWGQHP